MTIDTVDGRTSAAAKLCKQRAEYARRTATISLTLTVAIGLSLLAIVYYITVNREYQPNASINPKDLPISIIIEQGILRFGIVLTIVFVMQVMIMFVRYNSKMYAHWAMCEVLFSFAETDDKKIVALSNVIMPTWIDFGKTPNAPGEKILSSALSTIREISKKIPEK